MFFVQFPNACFFSLHPRLYSLKECRNKITNLFRPLSANKIWNWCTKKLFKHKKHHFYSICNELLDKKALNSTFSWKWMSREVFKRKKYTRKKTPRYKCLYSIVSCFKLWISDANVYVLEWNTQLGNESLVLHVQA